MRIQDISDIPPALRARNPHLFAAQPPERSNGRAKAEEPEKPKRSKMRNKITEQDGRTFGSAWEAKRFRELQSEEAAGLITDLRHHVEYPLNAVSPSGDVVRIAEYEADFTYTRIANGRFVVEDTKGAKETRTELYKLKAKMFSAQYGFAITEVYRNQREGRKAS